jgi:serine/threonine-protein kinase
VLCRFCGRELIFVEGDVKYSLVRIIKTGGQAVIFEAVDDVHPRSYAVKEIVLPLDPERASEAFQRCAIEARLLATLAHPGIPRFYHSLIKDGRVYLVMDLVRGNDLEDILRQRGKLPERTVLSIVNQVCDILHYLHTQPAPVIFRDVKPSNIMLDADGLVTMIDFGIARFTNSQRGNIMGTPGYAPPEQYRGDVTPASDQYALGATMHHLLSGRDPRGQKPFLFPALTELAPEISPLTAAIVHRALQSDIEQRFESILAMRNAIRAVMLGEETTVLRLTNDTTPIPTRPMISTPPPPIEIDYETQVILNEQNLDPTRELTWHTPNGATPSTAMPSASTPVATPAHVPAPRTTHQAVIVVVSALICAALVWSSQRQPELWQQLAQQSYTYYLSVTGNDYRTIRHEFTLTVTADQDLNQVFQMAFTSHVAKQITSRWQYTKPPQFLAQPPRIISQHPDGSAVYTAWMQAEIQLQP